MVNRRRYIIINVIMSLALGFVNVSSVKAHGRTDSVSYTLMERKNKNNGAETDVPLPFSGDMVEQSNELLEKYNLDENQLNQIAMLNYMSFLAEEIRQSDAGKVYLDHVTDILVDNLNPSSINSLTKERINTMVADIGDLSMTSVKRERLAYLYEQSQAAALRNAVPSPMSILTVVQSGSPLKATIAVLGMAIDSKASYEEAKREAELENLKNGWELDDQDFKTIQRLRTESFNYMLDMAGEYNIKDEITMNESAIQEFVKWKNNNNAKSKIQFLTSNSDKYEMYGDYWLLLSSSYYDDNNSKKCIESMDKYLSIKPGIFRIDGNMAEMLPKVITSLPEVYKGKTLANKELYYVNELYKNTRNNDYNLRYFAALAYLDIYRMTNDKSMLETAYEIIKNNVNNYCSNQEKLNDAYLSEVVEAKKTKEMTKKETKEIDEYNQSLKDSRKKELPPVDNVLFMNTTLMLDLAKELNISKDEADLINGILHNNGNNLFLVDSVDNNLWYGESREAIEPYDLLSISNVSGLVVSIPANYVCDSSTIKVIIEHKDNSTVVDDWVLDSVDRKKKSKISDFIVTYKSKEKASQIIKAHELLEDGDTITVYLYPYTVLDKKNKSIQYFDPITTTYKVHEGKVTLELEKK